MADESLRDGSRLDGTSSRRSSVDSTLSLEEHELQSFLVKSHSDEPAFKDDKDDKAEVTRLENTSHDEPDLDAQAKQHRQLEHSLTIAESIRACPMAIFWCLMVSSQL